MGSIGYTPIYSDTRTGLRDLPHLHLSMYSTKGLWSQRCDGKIRGRELVPAILVKFLFVDSDLHPLNARCCLRVTSPIFHTLVYTKMKTNSDRRESKDQHPNNQKLTCFLLLLHLSPVS